MSGPLTEKQIAALNALWAAETPDECSKALQQFGEADLFGMFGRQLPLIGWQPIETAPKDGRDMLLWNGECQCVGAWATESDRYGNVTPQTWHSVGPTVYGPDDATIDPPPTHWMPLPAPPQAPEG